MPLAVGPGDVPVLFPMFEGTEGWSLHTKHAVAPQIRKACMHHASRASSWGV